MVLQAEAQSLGDGEAMSAMDREALLREASKQKLRGMRLRNFGDAYEQWEATLFLRKAAKNELAALELQTNPSDEEQARARIEACGLFLDAHDPIRAAEQWNQIPRSFFPPNPEPVWFDRLAGRYRESVRVFYEEWRAIKSEINGIPSVDAISTTGVRTLVERFEGVPEFWWAHFQRFDEPASLKRAVELEPEFERDSTGHRAWNLIEDQFVQAIQVKVSSTCKERALHLDWVSRVATAFSDLLSQFVTDRLKHSIELIPVSATPGSFVWNINARGLPKYAIAELQERATEAPEEVGAQKLVALLEQLDENKLDLVVTTANRPGSTPELVFDVERRKPMLEAARAVVKIASIDIPQANSLERVFQMVEMYAKDHEVSPKILKIEPRQISYYKHAMRILGFIDDNDKITPAGRQIARLQHLEARLGATVVHFESSICGEAWIRWSKVGTLLEVDPQSAAQFIQECAVGINSETIKRRAQCLAMWHAELIPYHYVKS